MSNKSLVRGNYYFKMSLLNRVFVILFAGFIFFSPLEAADAQETASITQRLTWTKTQNAARYEIIVKKENPSAHEYAEFLRRSTADVWYDVTLTPGRYSFQVVPYSQSDAMGVPSDWEYFEVVLGSGSGKGGAIRPERAVNAEIALLWTPFLSLPYANSEFNTRYTGKPFQLGGAAIEVSLVLLKVNTSYWGMDFSPSWNYLEARLTDDTSSVLTTPSFSLYLFYQHRFNAKQLLNFRAGAGVYLFVDARTTTETGGATETVVDNFSTNLGVQGGVSFKQMIGRELFVKVGADYVYFVISQGRRAHFIVPQIGLGFRY